MQNVNRAFVYNDKMHSDKAKLKRIQIKLFFMLLIELSSKRHVINPFDVEGKVSKDFISEFCSK